MTETFNPSYGWVIFTTLLVITHFAVGVLYCLCEYAQEKDTNVFVFLIPLAIYLFLWVLATTMQFSATPEPQPPPLTPQSIDAPKPPDSAYLKR